MGLDIGLSKAGLHVVIGQDFEPACVETMKANGHKVLGGDIRNIEPETMLQLSGLHKGEPFLICGGPPCQPFSTAGKRLGINDPRGRLYSASLFYNGKCKRDYVSSLKACSGS